jgi:hypothetical protein
MVGDREREKKGIILKYKNVYCQNRFHIAESTNLVHIMYLYNIIYSRTIFHKMKVKLCLARRSNTWRRKIKQLE